MTEAIYLEVTEMAETAHKAKRQVSVSGMLKHLGVSRSGYHAWLKRVPSNTEKDVKPQKPKSKIFMMNLNRIMVPLKSPRNYVNQEKSSPNVLLVNITDCGAACIATICKQNGYKISITRIREVAGTDKQGTNVYGVIKAAEHFGFSAKG